MMRISPVSHALRAAARRPAAAAASARIPLAALARPASSQAAAKKQMVSITEIDRLLTHIAESSGRKKSDTPMVMRAHPVPWMAAGTGLPELETASHPTRLPPLTEAEREALLQPKHMSASYTSFDLPLATDQALYDQYVNFSGGFRMGKLLENLDSLAGAVAYRHCLANAPAADGRATENFHQEANRVGIYLATASADRLDMFGKLNHENVRDIQFSGFVTWTGNSSMEVFVKMQGKRLGASASDTLMLGRFSMVCRDTHTNKARKVPPLIVETAEEKALWQIGQDHKQNRQEFQLAALDKKPPTEEEAAELHKFMLATRNKTEHNGSQIVKMSDTRVEKCEIMFPQERNLHGKVFGGFLMRMAFELCFTNAAIFAQQPLRFLSLDQITFRLPVPVGSILLLSSMIVKTTEPDHETGANAKAHIKVKAEVEDIETGVRRETNTFYFTMAREDGEPFGKIVVPERYEEAMYYLEGERRLEVGAEMRRLYRFGVEELPDSPDTHGK